MGGFFGYILICFNTSQLCNIIPAELSKGLTDIGAGLSFWVFTTSIIARYSRSPLAAGFHSLCFLFSIVAVYYIFQTSWFGSFSKKHFIYQSIFSVLSFFCGYAIWYARGDGKLAAFCTAIPVIIILQEGITTSLLISYNNHLVFFHFCILASIILLIVLPKNNKQRIQSLCYTLISTSLLSLRLL